MEIRPGDRLIAKGKVMIVDSVDTDRWIIRMTDRYGGKYETLLSNISGVKFSRFLIRSDVHEPFCADELR